MSSRPSGPPLGLQLARTARAVTRAFEQAMASAGASASAWQVLVIVRSAQWGTQAEMAKAMGLTGATLTHHLNALEAQGLVRRWRDPGNRRVQQTELTQDGIALFDRLRRVAATHDARLRSLLDPEEAATLARLLAKLSDGFADDGTPAALPRADP